jgi:hypothetical protein
MADTHGITTETRYLKAGEVIREYYTELGGIEQPIRFRRPFVAGVTGDYHIAIDYWREIVTIQRLGDGHVGKAWRSDG